MLKSENEEPNFNHEDRAPLNALIKRVFEVIWEGGKIPRRCPMITDPFSDAEHEVCRRLENVMNYICETDNVNICKSNIITRIFVHVRNVFQLRFQTEWYDLKRGYNGQILARCSLTTVWDNNLRQYVPKTEENRNLWTIG